MRRFLKPFVALVALTAVAGCEDPYSGQVMCWQDNTVTPAEVICVPLRAMRGRPVPQDAFIVGRDGGMTLNGNGGMTPGTPQNPVPGPTPSPASVIEFTSVGETNVAVEVDTGGRVQSSQAGGGSAAAFDSADPGSGQSTQDVFDQVGSQLEDAGLVNPFSQ